MYDISSKVLKIYLSCNLIKIVFITDGYLSDEAIDYYSNFADAIAIDFKGNGNDDFGRKFISIPSYQPIFRVLEEFSRKKDLLLFSKL